MEVHKLRQDLNLISVQYLCEQCDDKVAEKSNLVELLKLIHDRVRYPCNQWDYKEGRNAIL